MPVVVGGRGGGEEDARPAMLPPIVYHYFSSPLPYIPTLALQNFIHGIQLTQRRTGTHKDYLLLLQHRPVYTAGRRQNEDELIADRSRLQNLGADFVSTQRGGQYTYHGPGQVVGYPLLDLGRWEPAMSIREYVCRLQQTMKNFLQEKHGIESVPSDNTGIFVDGGKVKVASIGVQVRHRLTSHGFAFNVTGEPLSWFNQITACGLADVKAGAIAGRSSTSLAEDVNVVDQIPGLVEIFARELGRDMVRMEETKEDEAIEAILRSEDEAAELQRRHPGPARPTVPRSIDS